MSKIAKGKFVAKYQKMMGEPFGDIKKLSNKKSHKVEITSIKNFGQERDSNPRPPPSQTSKNPD